MVQAIALLPLVLVTPFTVIPWLNDADTAMAFVRVCGAYLVGPYILVCLLGHMSSQPPRSRGTVGVRETLAGG